jgi:hypothetical protein
MNERNPVMIVVLTFVTCGFYAFYHTYVTTQELTAATGRTDINPTTELLLNVVTCGFYGMYAIYRNQQIVDSWFTSRGIQHEAKAQTVGLMIVLTFVVGATWVVSLFIHQDELNKMAAQLNAGAGSQAPVTF